MNYYNNIDNIHILKDINDEKIANIKFDIIYIRFVMSHFSNELFNEIYLKSKILLKTNGWIQFLEPSFNNNKVTPSMKKWNQLLIEYSNICKKNIFLIDDFENTLSTDSDFVLSVKHHIKYLLDIMMIIVKK
jgi:hypothetical protein